MTKIITFCLMHSRFNCFLRVFFIPGESTLRNKCLPLVLRSSSVMHQFETASSATDEKLSPFRKNQKKKTMKKYLKK